jgi:phage terminase large subunit
MSQQIKILPKFQPLLDDLQDVRFYVCTSGRHGFKSFHISLITFLLVNNHKHRVFYTRYTYQSAKNTIISEVQEKINLLQLSEYYHTTQNEISEVDQIYKKRSRNNKNEKQRKITFGGIKTSSGNQTAKLKGLKDYSIFVLDEAQECTEESEFDSLQLSIRANDVNNKIILLLNPTDKTHWIYKRFFENSGVNEGFNGIVNNTCYINTSYLDALEWVNPQILYEINHLKETNPEKYNHLILGHWLDKIKDRCIERWRYGKFDESLPWFYGMDFGDFPDPDVLIKVAVDKVNKKIYCHEMYEMNEADHDTCINKVLSFTRRAIIADKQERRLLRSMRSAGLNVIDCIKYPNSVEDGVKLLNEYELIVTYESTKLGNECNMYHRKNGIIVDSYNHRIDAIRYVVHYLHTDNIKHKTKVVGIRTI